MNKTVRAILAWFGLRGSDSGIDPIPAVYKQLLAQPGLENGQRFAMPDSRAGAKYWIAVNTPNFSPLMVLASLPIDNKSIIYTPSIEFPRSFYSG